MVRNNLFSIGACGLVLLLVSTPLWAGKKFHFFLHSGLSMPGSPDSFPRYWDSGFNFGGGTGYTFSFATTFLTLRFNFDYSSFSLKKDKYRMDHSTSLPSNATIDGGSITITGISLNVKVAPMLPLVQPYFLSETGILIHDRENIWSIYGGDRETFVLGERDTAFSIVSFGAGVDFAYTDWIDLFVEGGYRVCLTNDEFTGYFPIKLGARLKW